MAAGFFDFKQFSIRNTDSAMKVGTDAVLLGAWMSLPMSEGTDPVSKSMNLLDIGTGTGVISIIATQRCHQKLLSAHIDAIDIDEASLREAQYNFEHCPWNTSLEAHLLSLQEFTRHCPEHSYDLIFSNPPYFTDALKAPDQRKSQARHNDTLPHSEIIRCAARLLKSGGILSLILPFEEAESFRMEILTDPDFRLHRVCHVHSTPRKTAFRQMIEFIYQPHSSAGFSSQQLFIHQDGDFSPAYRSLTRDFYLKF